MKGNELDGVGYEYEWLLDSQFLATHCCLLVCDFVLLSIVTLFEI